MHNRRLIDRQTGLLRHLTGEAFMFGTSDLAAAALDPDLQGMDIARLRLEAEFSFAKRTGRIRETFARTASMYGSRFTGVLREFAVACPPRTYERYPDARDFFDWLVERCADDPSVPAWTADVARIEIALARARTFRPSEAEEDALARPPNDASSAWYRAHPCAALTRCRYDVGPLFVPGTIRRRHRPPRPSPRDARLAPSATPGNHGDRPPRRSPCWSVRPHGRGSGSETASPEDASTRALVMNLSAQGLLLTCGNAIGRGRG